MVYYLAHWIKAVSILLLESTHSKSSNPSGDLKRVKMNQCPTTRAETPIHYAEHKSMLLSSLFCRSANCIITSPYLRNAFRRLISKWTDTSPESFAILLCGGRRDSRPHTKFGMSPIYGTVATIPTRHCFGLRVGVSGRLQALCIESRSPISIRSRAGSGLG